MDTKLEQILGRATELSASDIHLSASECVYFRIAGELQPAEENGVASFDVLDHQWLSSLASELLTDEQLEQLHHRGSVDAAFSWNDFRFRYNVFRRAGQLCFSIRQLAQTIPKLDELGIDQQLYDVCNLKDGLVLVAGPTGSGKSTTIAALIDRINQTRSCHVVTIEDPVEYLHPSKQSLVNQRQVGPDVESFHQALLDSLRQDPDVILVGELRDLETIRTAITAAETGHLVFATVHAGDTKTAIERLVSAYSAEEQNLAQRLVATVLRTVVVQHLLPVQSLPGGEAEQGGRNRALASERVHVNSGIANLIAGGNFGQLASIIQTSGEDGMWTLDESLATLLRRGMISEKTAKSLARQPEMLSQLARIRR
ncbi:MAG: PilT/PilU family type 4a pilus ATPase [Planctomycetota bacterium]